MLHFCDVDSGSQHCAHGNTNQVKYKKTHFSLFVWVTNGKTVQIHTYTHTRTPTHTHTHTGLWLHPDGLLIVQTCRLSSPAFDIYFCHFCAARQWRVDALLFNIFNKYHLSIKCSHTHGWYEIFSLIFSLFLPSNSRRAEDRVEDVLIVAGCCVESHSAVNQTRYWVRFFKPILPLILWEKLKMTKRVHSADVSSECAGDKCAHHQFLTQTAKFFFFACTNVGQETFHVLLVDSGYFVPSLPLPSLQTI